MTSARSGLVGALAIPSETAELAWATTCRLRSSVPMDPVPDEVYRGDRAARALTGPQE